MDPLIKSQLVLVVARDVASKDFYLIVKQVSLTLRLIQKKNERLALRFLI
jgi:hypothetical protein